MADGRADTKVGGQGGGQAQEGGRRGADHACQCTERTPTSRSNGIWHRMWRFGQQTNGLSEREGCLAPEASTRVGRRADPEEGGWVQFQLAVGGRGGGEDEI